MFNNNFNPEEFLFNDVARYLKMKDIDIICSDRKKYANFDFKADIVQPKQSENNCNYLNEKCFYYNKICKEKRNIYLYCYDCKTEFCRKCEIKHRETNNMHTKIIKVNEKNYRCLEHYDK